MPDRIPCSVNMLTRNSAGTLEAALQSVSDFAEIVIGDGGSTDATLAIATRYGCRIVDQDPRYLDRSGRLINYAGARSQLIPLSSYDWILYLDSDEILTAEAALTIAGVLSAEVSPEIGAFCLEGQHVVKGVIIEGENTLGSRQPRLFRRSAVGDFSGFIDEHFELASGYVQRELDARFLIPVPPLRHMIPKWIRYLRVFVLEAERYGPEWTDEQLPMRRSSIRWHLQGWLEAKRRGDRNRMPDRYEAAKVLFAGTLYAALRLIRLSQRVRRKS